MLLISLDMKHFVFGYTRRTRSTQGQYWTTFGGNRASRMKGPWPWPCGNSQRNMVKEFPFVGPSMHWIRWSKHHVTFVVMCDPDYACWTFRRNNEVTEVVRVCIMENVQWTNAYVEHARAAVVAVASFLSGSDPKHREKVQKALECGPVQRDQGVQAQVHQIHHALDLDAERGAVRGGAEGDR